MAAWQDDLIRASFGGAPFQVAAHEFQSGRRAAVHELPQRDLPFLQDLGRSPRTWRVSAYVLGDDYFGDRDRLVEACEGFPPGYPFKAGRILAHPYLGQVRAHCLSISLREEDLRGRIARFELVFVEVGEDLDPPQDFGAGDRLVDAAEDLLDQAEAAYAAAMVVVQVPEAALAAASAEVRKVGRALSRLDVFNGLQAEVANLGAGVRGMLAAGSELATSPADLVGTIRTTLAAVRGAANVPEQALAAYESLFGSTSPTLTGYPGGTAAAADGNAQATADMARAAALAGAAQAAAEVEFASNQEAAARRDALAAAADELAEEPQVPDAVYRALVTLRARLVEAVPGRSRRLEDVRTIVLGRPTPAVRLAYDLFDDVTREAEIVARNPVVAHPGFVPGGVPLEVLSG